MRFITACHAVVAGGGQQQVKVVGRQYIGMHSHPFLRPLRRPG